MAVNAASNAGSSAATVGTGASGAAAGGIGAGVAATTSATTFGIGVGIVGTVAIAVVGAAIVAGVTVSQMSSGPPEMKQESLPCSEMKNSTIYNGLAGIDFMGNRSSLTLPEAELLGDVFKDDDLGLPPVEGENERLVVAIDINGNRDLPAVIKCIQLVMAWSPRLIVVKSRALHAKMVNEGR